jgi:hypothetical protein
MGGKLKIKGNIMLAQKLGPIPDEEPTSLDLGADMSIAGTGDLWLRVAVFGSPGSFSGHCAVLIFVAWASDVLDRKSRALFLKRVEFSSACGVWRGD